MKTLTWNDHGLPVKVVLSEEEQQVVDFIHMVMTTTGLTAWQVLSIMMDDLPEEFIVLFDADVDFLPWLVRTQ